MLNRSASLAMSTSVLKALPGKLDIKRHSPSILYILRFRILLHMNTKLADKPVHLHNLNVYAQLSSRVRSLTFMHLRSEGSCKLDGMCRLV